MKNAACLFAMLLAVPLTAQPENTNTAITSCRLMPSVRLLDEECGRAKNPADFCPWISIAETFFAAGDEQAAALLQQLFRLSPEIAPRILAVAAPYLVLVLDEESCAAPEQLEILDRVAAGGQLREASREQDNVMAPLILRMVDFDPRALERMTPSFGKAAEPAVGRSLDALRWLVAKIGYLPQIQRELKEMLARTGGISPLPNGTLPPLPPKLAGNLAAIDRALDLARRGEAGEARGQIEALVASAPAGSKALLLARAGFGYVRLARLEDALALFKRAEPMLAKAPPEDQLSRFLGRILVHGQQELAGYLDLPNHTAAPAADSTLPPILEELSERMWQREAITVEGTGRKLIAGVLAGEIEPRTLELFLSALQILVPAPTPAGQPPSGALKQAGGTAPPGAKSWYQELSENLLLGREAEALAVFEKARAEDPHLTKILGAVLLASSAHRRDDGEGARRAMAQAVEMWEKELAQQRTDEAARGFGDKLGADIYLGAIDLTALEDHAADGLSLAERGRAFTLRRRLGLPAGSRRGGSPSAGETAAAEQIGRLQKDPGAGREELATQLDRFEAARLDRLLQDPGSQPAFPGAVEVAELQREALRSGETMLVFYPGLEGRMWRWRISRDELSLEALAMPAEGAIACLARAARWQAAPEAGRDAAQGRGIELLADCPEADPLADPAGLLYQALLSPVLRRVPRGSRLILVPHGELHAVPFAALRDPRNGRALADSFELVIAPSADAVFQLRRRSKAVAAKPANRRPAAGRPLVLGDPATHLGALPAARGEAEAVAKLLGVEPLLGEKATEAELFRRAATTTLLHVAAHGTYVPASPLFSAIQLAEGDGHDGALQVHEVWDRLDLSNVRLVVLSACDTAAGEPTRGDEILGLTQAFLVAGAPAVIATLWPVDDEASARLMTAFYRLFQQGKTAAGALRTAQLQLMADPATAAPYYWAGYTLVGDPDARWQDDEE